MIKLIIDIPYNDAFKLFKEFESDIHLSKDQYNNTFLILESELYDEIKNTLKDITISKINVDIILEKQEIVKSKNPYFGGLLLSF